jgi:TATA-binding protein-associated factor Taf7
MTASLAFLAFLRSTLSCTLSDSARFISCSCCTDSDKGVEAEVDAGMVCGEELLVELQDFVPFVWWGVVGVRRGVDTSEGGEEEDDEDEEEEEADDDEEEEEELSESAPDGGDEAARALRVFTSGLVDRPVDRDW